MAYITVYYIDFDTKEVISTYDYSLEVGQTQSINVQDHIPAGYLDLFTYSNGNFVYDNSIQVVADEPLYVNGQTGDRFTNNVICFVSATWDSTSNLPIDDLSDSIDLVSIIPTHTSEIAPVDVIDNISITENAMSGQFLTIGDICYPTCSVSLFKGEYTTATVFLKGSEFYVVAQMFGIYQILGKFTITNEPVVGTDTVSFEASGVLSSEGINSVVDLTEVLTEQRKTEILEVQPSLDHIIPASLNNMSYYWYFIVEDIYELFGIPLIIDRWDYCREDFIASNNIMELLIPTKTITTSDTDEDGVIETTIENEKEVTWKDIICNIALLLNCNIVEHGGVIHLKRLPTMESKAKKFYVGADIYDDNSRFSSNNYWLKSATIKYREYAIRNSFPQPPIIGGPEDAVFWGNNTRNHTAFEGIPTTWNAGAIEYETTVNCAYFRPYFWRSTQTNNQLITLLWNKRAAKALYRSFDIDEDITWEGLNVFNGVPDVVYTPADVSFLGWNPLMSIGNCFICVDYEGNNRIIYVGNQTISYSGGISVSVSSTCNLEDGTESEYTTSEISSTASGGVANIQSIVNQMLEGALIRDNVLNGSKITDATITGGKITDATITNTKIADSTITGSKIADSTITNTQIANSTITGSKIVDGTLDGSTKIADATISFAKIDNSFVGSLFADSAFVQEFEAEVATFGYITSAEADLAYADIDFANIGQSAITNLTSNTAFINALDAEIASFGYITAQQADLDYAKIDFANVANGAIGTALIQDGAISDAKIGGMSANKLTAGTIDASNITVTNLNATNITTGRITVDGITIDVTNNEASIDGGYIEDGTITMNGFSSDVVARIDGAIETFTCNDIPTLQNYPVNTWIASDYDKHVGDVAYVVNPSSSADGYTYRFTKSSDNQFSWVLIKDTDITKALQDIIDIQGDVDAIESFDSTVSSFMTNTDSEIKSIKSRTSSLETTMGTKVDTSTFNELSQTVDENSSSITSLSKTVSGKADSSTVSSLSNTVNTISQKTDANTSSISSLTTTVSSKADASNVYTKTETDSKISVVQQDLTGFKTTVSDTYATQETVSSKADNSTVSALTQRVTSAESNITQNATNITTKVSKTDFTGQNMMSMINQDASSVTISASKVNLNGYLNITNSFGNKNLFKLKDSVPGFFEERGVTIFPQAPPKERTTDYIPVVASGTYTVQAWYDTTNPTSSYEWICVNVYDSNKNYISQPIREHINSSNYKKFTLNIPSNGAYVRISSRWVEKGYEYAKVKLEKGTTASPWTIAPEDEVDSSDIYSANTTTIDGGKITTGTITANQITVGNLSDLSDDMGTITAGVLKSHNYVADTSGMKLTLSDGVWDSKDFKISSTGAITSTAGTIGGWTIDDEEMYCRIDDGSSINSISLDASIGEIKTSKHHVSQGYNVNSGLQMDSSITISTISTDVNDDSSGYLQSNDIRANLIQLNDGRISSGHYVDVQRVSLSANTRGYYLGLKITTSTNAITYYDATGITSDNSNFAITLPNASISSAGAISTSSTISATGLITAKGGVNSWGKLEGNTLKINNTGTSSFNILGGGSIAGALAVGGNITSNNKNVVVDNYSSGFMAFTNDTASANTVKSSTSVRYNLASVTLTPGVYIIECMAEWRSNSSTGYRDICLSTSSNGGKIDKYCESTVAPSNAYDRQIFTYTTHITSNTTFYLTAQQNSGGDISTLGGIRALRIGNN